MISSAQLFISYGGADHPITDALATVPNEKSVAAGILSPMGTNRLATGKRICR
jgi:hypothetical protein